MSNDDKLLLLDEQPIKSNDDNKTYNFFPHDKVISSLKHTIENYSEQITNKVILLSGRWGTGKTSVLNQLETQLKEKLFIKYNAWSSNYDMLLKEFMRIFFNETKQDETKKKEIDTIKKEKIINIISKNYEKWHVILNLWSKYHSRDTNERYKEVIRGLKDIQDIQQIQTIIDNKNIEYIHEDEAYHISNLSELFINHKEFYKIDLKVTRYILMRMELELKKITGQPSRIENFQQFWMFASKSAQAHDSIHIEHIYAWNDNNLDLFENNKDEFNNERNKLGMVLLLLGSQNQSSGNESYQDKLDCYSKSNFIWNELLSNHIDGIIYKKLPKELQIQYSVTPNSSGIFPKEDIQIRQQAIFNMIKFIWNF